MKSIAGEKGTVGVAVGGPRSGAGVVEEGRVEDEVNVP